MMVCPRVSKTGDTQSNLSLSERGNASTSAPLNPDLMLQDTNAKFVELLAAVQGLQVTLGTETGHFDYRHGPYAQGTLDELAGRPLLHSTPSRDSDSVLLGTALHVLRRYAYDGQQRMPFAPRLPIWAIPECAGLRTMYRIRDWEEAGIVKWVNVVTEEGFCTFDTLVVEHGLGLDQFLLYSSLRGVIHTTWESDWEQTPIRASLETALMGGIPPRLSHAYILHYSIDLLGSARNYGTDILDKLWDR
ncbi:hypothetical protein NDU88_004962 [Pleurodeles waltl]|uniref:Uncharacterized protein n=1 Tax=Pleurodeles waltl TaxID=8319 RepID=A0AAV7KZ95_PLEWA|nr:hypothetical protein NDU88_004962 [Pleurodeles waltl]